MCFLLFESLQLFELCKADYAFLALVVKHDQDLVLLWKLNYCDGLLIVDALVVLQNLNVNFVATLLRFFLQMPFNFFARDQEY